MNDIVYHNPDRTKPLILESYIYVVIAQFGTGIVDVIDSYFIKEDAEAAKKTVEANQMNQDNPDRLRVRICESRLYK